MGLDTTHDCWHGSYRAFAEWRNALATAAGYDLVEVGTTSGHHVVCADIGDDLYTEDHARGVWKHPPEDFLHVLLTHSDAEYRIRREHTSSLADRLESLLPALDSVAPALAPGGERPVPLGYTPIDPPQVEHWKAQTRRFVAGLRTAAAAGEAVKFR